MKKHEIEIGREYVAKVSGKLAVVKILRESPYGGWEAVNRDTGRDVRIKSAARLRRPARTDAEVAAIMERIKAPLRALAAYREYNASHANILG